MSMTLRWCLVLLSFLMINASGASGIARHFGPQEGFASSLLKSIPAVEVALKHGHHDSIDGLAAAEADRLVAMIAITHCDIKTAEQLFTYAYMHDQENEITLYAIHRARKFLYEESLRRTFEARESEKVTLEYERYVALPSQTHLLYILQLNQTKFMYLDALECDENNPIARAGYARMWIKQHGSWTFTDRLGYYRPVDAVE